MKRIDIQKKDYPCRYCGGEIVRKRYKSSGNLENMQAWNNRDWCIDCIPRMNEDRTAKARKSLTKKPVKTRKLEGSELIVSRWLTGAL